jgi:hypothetical protein
MEPSSGLIYIHGAPQALLAHIEWTISGVSGTPQNISWVSSPVIPNQFQSVNYWRAKSGDGAILASALMNLKQITFEVTQSPNGISEGYRWSYTPTLGMFQCLTDSAGNLLISENQLRLAMETAGGNQLVLNRELRRLLGQSFDDALEEARGAALLIAAEGDDGVMSTEAERVANRQEV